MTLFLLVAQALLWEFCSGEHSNDGVTEHSHAHILSMILWASPGALSFALKDDSALFSSCLASYLCFPQRSVRCICSFLDLPGSDWRSEGYPLLGSASLKRCLLPPPASLDLC